VLPVFIECLRHDANEGNRWTECVAYRGVTAGRIPSKKSIGGKPQSNNPMLSLHKLKRRGRNLDDVGTATGIKQVGTPELMRKCLAIVAVADHAIHSPGRRIRDRPADFSATAM
jgi:hypothetical protein